MPTATGKTQTKAQADPGDSPRRRRPRTRARHRQARARRRRSPGAWPRPKALIWRNRRQRRGGRVTWQDIAARVEPRTRPEPELEPDEGERVLFPRPTPSPETDERKSGSMPRRRRTIAQRLVEAQQTAAILTTFNETT